MYLKSENWKKCFFPEFSVSGRLHLVLGDKGGHRPTGEDRERSKRNRRERKTERKGKKRKTKEEREEKEEQNKTEIIICDVLNCK
jgi:hypothetical protein